MPLVALALTVILCAVPVAQVGWDGWEGQRDRVAWAAAHTCLKGCWLGCVWACMAQTSTRLPCPPLHHYQVADVLRASGLAACGPVLLLHFFGYLLGYLLPRLLGFNEKTSRTGGGGVEL